MVEVVHNFGGSSAPPIELDSLGHAHVLACPPGELWYAVRGGSWSKERVATTVAGGVCGKLALDTDGDPHITSPPRPGDPGQMYAVKRGGVWAFSPLPFPAGDLEVDSGGVASIVDIGNFPDGRLRYARMQGSWSSEDVDVFGPSVTVHWEDLEFDAGGRPHILYYDDIRGDVRYAFRDASGWHVEVVEHIGPLNIAGREGSLALAPDGTPHAVYTVPLDLKNTEVRHAVRSGSSWNIELVSEPPPALGGRGQSPTVGMTPDGPAVLYRREWWLAADGSSLDEDLLYAVRMATGWAREVIYDGRFLLNDPSDRTDDVWDFAQFPTMVLDRCGNPHAAFYLNHRFGAVSDSGVYYATKGEPCGGAVPATLRVEPRTLNLRSRGRWVTATLTFGDPLAADVDLASVRLAGIPPDRVQVVNDTALVAKVSRREFAATIERPGAVEVCTEGALRDGRTFRACDTIRVIRPGR